MAKRGRKRKEGQRHKGGKLVQPERQEHELDIKSIGLIARDKKARLSELDNPKLEGPLGEAYTHGRIDEQQIEAGALFNVLVRKYAAVTGIPMMPRTTSRMDPLPPGDPLKEAPSDEEVKSVRAEYDAAFDVLKNQGVGIAKEVSRVAVRGEPVSWAYGLQQGLSALVEHFGIESGKAGESPASKRIRRYVVGDYKPKDEPALRENKKSA